jgi:transposase InsO family protein
MQNNKNSAIFLPLKINKIYTDAFLDSGCFPSLISVDKLEKFRFGPITPCADEAISLSGHSMSIMGSVTSDDIQLGDQIVSHKFWVIPRSINNIVIGRNFMEIFPHWSMHFKENTLKVGNEKYPLLTPKKGLTEEVCTVFCMENVEIPPESSILLPGRANFVPKDKIAYFQPNLGSLKHILFPAHSVVSMNQESTLMVSVINPEKYPVTLLKNTRLGTLYPVQPMNNEPADPLSMLCAVDLNSDKGRQLLIELQDTILDLKNENPEVTRNQHQRLIDLLIKYSEQHLFCLGRLDVGKIKNFKAELPLLPGTTPVNQKAYRLAERLKGPIRAELKEMQAQNIIQQSSSAWSSPCVVIASPNFEKIRFTVDYRFSLNKYSDKQAYPLPNRSDLLSKLGNAKYFCHMDAPSSFFSIELMDESRAPTAFSIDDQLFEFCRLPQGYCNSPQIYNRVMRIILSDLLAGQVLLYMDDAICYSNNFDEMLMNLENIFLRFVEFGIRLNFKKCAFMKKKLKFLGVEISAEGQRPDPKAVEVINNYPVPETLRQNRGFLGAASFFRNFVPNFARIAAPLHALCKKTDPLIWTDLHQDAFDTLKMNLINAPILTFPRYDGRSFILTTDSSFTGMGCMLTQKNDEDPPKECAIAYYSRGLTKAELNVKSAVVLEGMALVWSLKQNKPVIWGYDIICRVDCASLRWLQESKNLSERLTKLSTLLSEWNVKLEIISGKSNTVADALSRLDHSNMIEADVPDKLPEDEILTLGLVDTPDVITIKPRENTKEELADFDPFLPDGTISIKVEQRKDKVLSKIINFLENEVLPKTKKGQIFVKLNAPNFLINNEILCYKPEFLEKFHNLNNVARKNDVIAVPHSMKLHLLIGYHDSMLGGSHLSHPKVSDRLLKRFYWPEMKLDSYEYVKSCPACAARKGMQKVPHPALRDFPLIDRPGYSWIFDHIGPLPETDQGNTHILLFVDEFSRYPEAYPVRGAKAADVARIFLTEICARHGCPRIARSDNSMSFKNELMAQIFRMTGTRQVFGAPRKPSSQGICERLNQQLYNCISSYVNNKHDNWDLVLPFILMGIRASFNASTHETPAFLQQGRDFDIPFTGILTDLPDPRYYEDETDYAVHTQLRLQTAWELVKENITMAREIQKRNFDEKHLNNPYHYRIGDKVYLKGYKNCPKGRSPKLHRKFYGPWRILRVENEFNYFLQLISYSKKTLSAHYSRIKPYFAPYFPKLKTVESEESEGSEDEEIEEDRPLSPELPAPKTLNALLETRQKPIKLGRIVKKRPKPTKNRYKPVVPENISDNDEVETPEDPPKTVVDRPDDQHIRKDTDVIIRQISEPKKDRTAKEDNSESLTTNNDMKQPEDKEKPGIMPEPPVYNLRPRNRGKYVF